MPPTCSRKPAKLRDMNTQPSNAATMANTKPMFNLVVGTSVGSRKPLENMRDCGKLKPIGSRQGPVTR